ncbi:putative salicylate hydroxylase [Nemania abortiva]|nr:putative salicylate hydroxylase [Nemania abortiva]
METQHDDSAFAERRAVKALSVIVIGGGIGGLAIGLCMRKTGHDVLILEKRKEITEVGAGIQLAPNATRILRRFGVLDETMKHAIVLERNSLRRWKDDEELGSIPLGGIEDHFGAPLAVIHRADLQRVLLDAAIDSGCRILEDHEVIDIDPNFLPVSTCLPSYRVFLDLGPNSKGYFPLVIALLLSCSSKGLLEERIHVHSPERDVWMSADLVLAADGMNSIVRRRMAVASGHVDQLVPHGESAYRFILASDLVKHDATVMGLIGKNQGMRYMGPGGHIMAYPLRKNTLYNVVLIRKAEGKKLGKTSWTARGRKEEILEHYRGWSPVIQALISHVPGSEVLETPMNDMPPLPTWVKGKIALAGDACHYMLPYVAQGASNALEDAGVLAMAFTCTDQIEPALALYESIRKDRSERIQASATNTGNTLHLPDGEEQIRRDEAIRAASRGVGPNPDKWNDKQSREFMWRVDVMAETINKFESLAQETGNSRG